MIQNKLGKDNKIKIKSNLIHINMVNSIISLHLRMQYVNNFIKLLKNKYILIDHYGSAS